MARIFRVEIDETIENRSGRGVPNATVEVRRRSDNSLATVYSTETGTTTLSNPLTTDSAGRIEGYVEEGSYNLVVTNPGYIARTTAWEAVPARGLGGAPILADLPKPLQVAHRGSQYTMPENTMEAFHQARGAGLKILETDAHLLRDGSLGLMHDTTVDRTTTSTGSTSDHNSQSWRGLVVDSSAQLDNAPGYPNTRPPLLTEFLNEFGGKAVLMIEAKGANTAARQLVMDRIVDQIVSRGLEKSVLLNAQDTTLSLFAGAVAAGIPCAMTGLPADNDAAYAAGIRYVFTDTTTTGSQITALQGAGLKSLIYNIDDRYTKPTWDALGVDGYFSNDSIYVFEKNVEQTTDPFKLGTWWPGKPAVTGFRGTLLGTGRWVPTSNGYYPMGWAVRKTPATTYSLTVGFKLENSDSTDLTRFAGVAFCASSDAPIAQQNCYEIIFRENGQVVLYKRTGASVPQVAATSATDADMVVGAERSVRIDVTATTITATRLDTSSVATTTDSAYRGGYVFFSRTSNLAQHISFGNCSYT